MDSHHPHDKELADLAQDRMLRRKRLSSSVSGDGTFSEDEYAALVAHEVERAQAAYAALLKRTRRYT